MRYIELKNNFKDFFLFSLNDIRKIDEKFNRRRLYEWKEKKYIKQIIKGYYIFTGQDIDEPGLFFISNQIYKPSYISLETSFAFFEFIPETVFAVTSVSCRKTKTFSTIYGKMIYQHIHPRYFFGYNLVKMENLIFKLASPEKAILDFLYLNPHLNKREDIEELRFNSEQVLGKIDKLKFKDFLERFGKKSLEKRVQIFFEVIDND